MDKTMLLKPRMSEKAYAQSQGSVYVFVVPQDANKHSVASAIAAQFSVSVTNVNIANQSGKAKRTVRKGGRAIAGRTADQKKAYVTLKDGDSIPVFAAVEEAEQKAEKTQAAVEQAKKKAGK